MKYLIIANSDIGNNLRMIWSFYQMDDVFSTTALLNDISGRSMKRPVLEENGSYFLSFNNEEIDRIITFYTDNLDRNYAPDLKIIQQSMINEFKNLREGNTDNLPSHLPGEICRNF